MTTTLFTYAVSVGLLMLVLGILGIAVNRVLHDRPRLAVDDPAPDHEDDLTALMDAVKDGAMVPPESRYARVHRDCARAWSGAAYDAVCNECFDLLGRSADVGLDIFEVTQ